MDLGYLLSIALGVLVYLVLRRRPRLAIAAALLVTLTCAILWTKFLFSLSDPPPPGSRAITREEIERGAKEAVEQRQRPDPSPSSATPTQTKSPR